MADTLALENGVSRARALGYLANTALECLRVGELEARLSAVEEQFSVLTKQRKSSVLFTGDEW